MHSPIKINFILITSLLLFLSGCKVKHSYNTAEEKPIDRFNTVIGLKRGDTIEKVYEIYGQPTIHTENSEEYTFNSVHYYVEDTDGFDKWVLSFSYYKNTRKIFTIRVKKDAPILFRKKKIDDIIYIGFHADKIRELFGPKEYNSADILEYETHKMQVDFYCYNFFGYNCYEYCVYWFS